jgi:protein-histidine pros-kinase
VKLLLKFNLIFIALFGAGLLLISHLAYQMLMSNARDQVVQQAALMMESARATRDYTAVELEPLLRKDPDYLIRFLPQTVPAYGATVTFDRLRKVYPEYGYKEATLNPTNLRDRAVDWEADVITFFRNHPEQKEIVAERDTPTGRSLYLAHPIPADPPCLKCHSTPEAAPRQVIATYGRVNGFGWKPHEIVAAQIISVPLSIPVKIADQAFRSLLIYVAAVFLFSVAMIDAALYFMVIRPVRRLSEMADRISLGDLDTPALPVSGKDEIAAVAASFNRMYLSLVKAFKMLNG